MFGSMELRRGTHSCSQARHYGTLLLVIMGVGCDKTFVVGTCEPPTVPTADAGTDDGGTGAGSDTLPIELPWSSGFESGFCDFAEPLGYCYQRGTASFKLVTSPVHSGTFAAAFAVNSDTNAQGTQARCVRQGTLPARAKYGAWYYVPQIPTADGFWNLFHFEGQAPGVDWRGLWDVQLNLGSDGQLRLTVYDFVTPRQIDLPEAPPIPIATWFHVEFYFARASDETGQITLLQDGETLLDLSGIVTDDRQWGRWFVGNLAINQLPLLNTVFVDDVTIDATP